MKVKRKIKCTYEQTLYGDEIITHLFYRPKLKGIPVKHLKKGTMVVTAANRKGLITGRKRGQGIEIQMLQKDELGRFDYLDKDALVQEIK